MTSTATAVQPARTGALPAVLVVWLVLAAILYTLLAIGISPNGDADDIMKLQEIRHMLTGASLFDRTIPGVSQPEPMVSHWPWIADAPFAFIAWLLKPMLGLEPALKAAGFIVPPMLLAAALAALYRINVLLGFAWPGVILMASAVLALTALAEFQPGRIDYHNLQMLLLCAVALFTMQGGKTASAFCGAATALSFAISSEIAPFLVVPMAWLALRFALAKPGSNEELHAYGLALAVAAFAAFLVVSLPQGGDLALCDRYGLPHLLALGGAGVTFAIASYLPARIGFVGRLALIAVGGIASVIALVTLFPGCLDGPYGALSPYLHQNWLMQIEQEMSLLAAPDALSSARLGKLVLAVVGASAGIVWAWNHRETRAWLTFGLFCAVGLVMSVAYIRYLRFLPLLATPGLALLLWRVMPVDFSTRKWLAPLAPDRAPSAALMAAPALALLAAVFAWRAVAPPKESPILGIDVASACSRLDFDDLNWPQGSRALMPPPVAMQLLGKPGAPDVVAVPFHTSGPGIERVYRFFDPATPDPQRWLTESKATYVAACRFEGTLPDAIVKQFPLAASLATGKPPAWLETCSAKETGLRVYRPTGSSTACPQ